MMWIYFKTVFVLSVCLHAEASPVAMLQHPTSSQSFVIHQPQVSPSSANLASEPSGSSIGPAGGGNLNQPKYEYKYEVSDHGTGDRKSHWESREGDRVRGVYTLYEPDGALRRVQYTADSVHGFNAIVTRDGQSKHHPPQVTPNYGPSSRSGGDTYEPSSRAYIPDQRAPSSGYGSDRSRAYLGSNAVDNAGFSVTHGTGLKASDVGPKPY